MRSCLGICFFAILLTSCAKSIPTTSPNQSAWLETLAAEQLGQNSTIEPNRDLSFSLCWNEVTNESNNMPVVKFIIVRSSDHKVVEQGSVTMGVVKWTADYEVEVSPAPGQVVLDRGVNTITRTIDVKKYLDRVGR